MRLGSGKRRWRIPEPLTLERRAELLEAVPSHEHGWFYASEISAKRAELFTLEDEGLLVSHAEHGASSIVFRRRA